MDILDAIGSGKYLRYRSNIMNPADQINLPNQQSRIGLPVNMDEVEIYEPTPLEIRQSWWPYFCMTEMRATPELRDVVCDVESQVTDAVNKYLDGTMSDKELSEIFTTQLNRLWNTCKERDYPIPGAGGADGEQAIADCFFDDFRKKLLNEAVNRNYAEGLRHASNGKSGNWLYYNSDYYYKTESAISAITTSVMNYCHEKGYDDFALTPRKDHWEAKVIGYNYYEDFNSAWEHCFSNSHTFIDKNQAPPKDFILFYETGGTFGPGQVAMIPKHKADGAVFDPTDFLSARIWVSYRDSNGNLHGSTTIFAYDFDPEPLSLKTLDTLLSFKSVDQDDPLRKFLKNLQVFPLGYFDKYPSTRVDIHA